MPAQLAGYLYEEGSSRRSSATLGVDSLGNILIDGESSPAGVFSDVAVPPRIGDGARVFSLADGRSFETQDNDALDALVQRFQDSASTRAHRIETNAVFIALSVLLSIGLMYLFITVGIPRAGDYAAARVPDDVRRQIGDATLKRLDDNWLGESTLGADRRASIRALFARLTSEDAEASSTRLLFRAGPAVGANALALPGGTVIVTDELVELAENDAQLASVLLHEIGHIEHDHGMRSVLRQAGLSLLVLLISGDVSTASTLIIMVPTALLTMRYSRDFEREADGYALAQMLRQDIDPRAFAEVMRLLEASAEPSEESVAGEVLAYFASHPDTEERIRAFEGVATP